jgi:hypothetical protein
MTTEDEALDLMALVEEADFGKLANVPAPTASRNVTSWVEAERAGIPEHPAPAEPWTPRKPLAPVPEPVSPIPEAP